MNPELYEYMQKNQTPAQRVVTAIFYPILKLMAMYFAVMFFALMLEEIDFHE